MSLKNKLWKLKNSDLDKNLIERLLTNRGLQKPAEIDHFFNLEFSKSFPDPFLLKDIHLAIERIRQAITNQEKIIIFGDYDVDGITSTAILFHTLKELGALVSYRLPHRVHDGYGLSKKFIEEFSDIGVSLIITVDCGISSWREITFAKEKNIDTIITDHHSLPINFPSDAVAVIHPKQKDCLYPYKELTGAGIAWKLSQALIQTFYKKDVEQKIKNLLDLACLGTVADCAPLTGENRSIVKFGLESLKNTNWRGLKYLKEKAGIKPNIALDTYMVGFYLAPRLNAAGRIDNPYFSLQLLLNGEEKAAQFASKLEELNHDRQELTKTSLEQAERILGPNIEKEKIIIAHHPDWHIGIVGLVAGKLAEKYARPVIIMEDRGDKLFASARSPEFFSIVNALSTVQEYLEHFGGHTQAAGFILKKENLPSFISAMKKYADEKLKLEDLKATLSIDCEIQEKDLNFDTYHELQKFAPFGEGNHRPLFLLKDVEISHLKNLGKEGQHLKFNSKINQKSIPTIAFGMGQFRGGLKEYQRISLACEISENVWNGNTELQLKAEDIKAE